MAQTNFLKPDLYDSVTMASKEGLSRLSKITRATIGMGFGPFSLQIHDYYPMGERIVRKSIIIFLINSRSKQNIGMSTVFLEGCLKKNEESWCWKGDRYCTTVRTALYQGSARNPLKFFKARKCHDKIIVSLLGILNTLEK